MCYNIVTHVTYCIVRPPGPAASPSTQPLPCAPNCPAKWADCSVPSSLGLNMAEIHQATHRAESLRCDLEDHTCCLMSKRKWNCGNNCSAEDYGMEQHEYQQRTSPQGLRNLSESWHPKDSGLGRYRQNNNRAPGYPDAQDPGTQPSWPRVPIPSFWTPPQFWSMINSLRLDDSPACAASLPGSSSANADPDPVHAPAATSGPAASSETDALETGPSSVPLADLDTSTNSESVVDTSPVSPPGKPFPAHLSKRLG